MLIAWMVMAVVFTLCVGFAAYATDRLRRTQQRTTRGVWTAALAVAVIWPLTVPVLRPLWFESSVAQETSRNGGATPAPDAGVVASAPTPFAKHSALTQMRGWPLAAERVLLTLAQRWPWLVPLTLAAWTLMSALLLLRLLLASRRVSTLARTATRTTIDRQDVLLAHGFGPASIGVRAPRIVVPHWVLALDAPLRAFVLQHEHEHCQSGDPRFVWGAALATALMPWNPGV